MLFVLLPEHCFIFIFHKKFEKGDYYKREIIYCSLSKFSKFYYKLCIVYIKLEIGTRIDT